MILAKISDNKITVSACDILTTGSVNYNLVSFSFSSAWTSLIRTAVFKVDNIEQTVLLDSNNKCYIPYALLIDEYSNRMLKVGVNGYTTTPVTGTAVYNSAQGYWVVDTASTFYNDAVMLRPGDAVTITNQIGWTDPMSSATVATMQIDSNSSDIYFQLVNSTGTLINGATASFGFNKDSLVITTPFADIGRIQDGANGSNDASLNPDLPIWQTLKAEIGDLANLSTTDKSNLVSAVNEVLAKSDKTFIYTQTTASSSWDIVHNLDKYPSVTITDSGKNIVTGNVQFVSKNELIITFQSAFSGVAYLN